MGFNWKRFQDGDRFKFEEIGAKIEGTITRIGTTDFGGTSDLTPVIYLKVDTGEEVSVTAGNVMLVSKLAELGPNEGDWISMSYIGDGEKKPGRSAPKLFDVIVKPGSGAAAPPAADATAPDPADEPF